MDKPFVPGRGVQICPTCWGAGFYNYLAEIIDCENCDGAGTINLNSEE